VLDLEDKSQMQAQAGSVNSAARICLDSPEQNFKSELDFHGSSSTHHIILTIEGWQTPFCGRARDNHPAFYKMRVCGIF
jgi:hypothetical protein